MAVVINATTKFLGLLGEHIAYTRSPSMHNAAIAALGRNEVYLALPLPAAQVAGFLTAAWTLPTTGFNITTPHKELVAQLYPAAGLASVNTLYRGGDTWLAASTDGPGFARGLSRLGRPLTTFKRLVVLGAGGASVALLQYFAREKLTAEVVVVRRQKHPERDRVIIAAAGDLPLRMVQWSVTHLTAELNDRGSDTLLIQATSAPQQGDDLASLVPALSGFNGTVCDLVYGQPSALFHAANSRGLPAQDGAPMLIEQARLAQELWWGETAPYVVMAAALSAV